MNTEIRKAVIVLCKALEEDKSDGSYYYSWQANIAVCMQDECHRWMEKNNISCIPKKAIHEISNNAAKEFLNLMAKVPLIIENQN